MKKLLIGLALLSSCASNMNDNNILMSEFKTTNGAIPFDKIKKSDYEPAFEWAIKKNVAEIEEITNNPDEPTFENTIVAFERSGKDLARILRVFDALLNADGDDELLAISERITPMVSEHSTSIILNEKLWKRIEYVHNNCDTAHLDNESKMLLKKMYSEFVNNGASLEGADRGKYLIIKLISAEIYICER